MIYDLTQINDELDMLEIRLNILDPYVDKFVIGESRQTFSGNSKPLYYEENKERFARWEDKIIHVKIPLWRSMAINTQEVVYQRTAYQKDCLRRGLNGCDPEDYIAYGDVDEVWTPHMYDGRHILVEGKCRQLAYSYYLNNRSSEDWQGTNLFKYKNIRDLNIIRADHSTIIGDGGWHFSNMGGYEKLLNKLESYDHQEANIPWVKDGLKARMEANVDYLGRTHDWRGNEFKMWVDESQLPKYLLDNKEKYKHLWKL